MPTTPDRYPGIREEERVKFNDPPQNSGEIGYDSGVGQLRGQDTLGVFDLRSGGGGITAEQHKVLLQLIHFIDEGPAEGFTTGATKSVTGTVFPTQELWERADTTKLLEKNITWTGVNPTTIEWKIYAADGITALSMVTDTITYSGVFETGRARVIA